MAKLVYLFIYLFVYIFIYLCICLFFISFYSLLIFSKAWRRSLCIAWKDSRGKNRTEKHRLLYEYFCIITLLTSFITWFSSVFGFPFFYSYLFIFCVTFSCTKSMALFQYQVLILFTIFWVHGLFCVSYKLIFFFVGMYILSLYFLSFLRSYILHNFSFYMIISYYIFSNQIHHTKQTTNK